MCDRTVLLFARQAGTANAFTEVARELQRRGCTVVRVAAGQARQLWPQSIATHVDGPEQLHAELACTPFDAVLSGTSFDAEGDGVVWAEARQRAVRCVAYVDGWSNYAERFSAVEPFDTLPDVIAVIDEIAAAELSTLGCPVTPAIVGNVVLDALRDCSPAPTNEALLYVGEQIDPERGFRSVDVARAVIEAVDGRWPIVIKPHPREDRASYDSHEELRVEIAEPGADRLRLLEHARAVVGITSMLLVEAAALGLPTLSLQPRGRELTSLINEARRIEIATDLGALRSLLPAIMNKPLAEPLRMQSAGQLADLVLAGS